jgi:hypothetical protein
MIGMIGKTQRMAVKKRTLRIMEAVNSANSESPLDFLFIAGPPVDKTDIFKLYARNGYKNLMYAHFFVRKPLISLKGSALKMFHEKTIEATLIYWLTLHWFYSDG